MNHFCTITTQSHLYKVHALADSLKEQKHDFSLHVLVVDTNQSFVYANCIFYNLQDLSTNTTTKIILSKYRKKSDKLRWSLKPVFLLQLLEKPGSHKVVYLDNDLFFYSDYSFIFNLLDEHSFLLTPHHYKHDPKKNQNWLEANFRVGLYNAGFIGVNKDATDSLNWWTDCCAYRCEKNSLRGTFDDQKYLDLIPVIQDGAHIIKHKGCNVAGWNMEICRREQHNGITTINGVFPIVFIHYNSMTIREIVKGNDNLLFPFYEKYFSVLKKHKPELKNTDLFAEESLIDNIKLSIWEMITNAGF